MLFSRFLPVNQLDFVFLLFFIAIFDSLKKKYEFYSDIRVFTQMYHALGIGTVLYLILLVSFISRTEKELLPSVYAYELFCFRNPVN